MNEVLDIVPIMDEKKISRRSWLGLNQPPADDPARQKLLIDETIFFYGKDMRADIRIVAIRINKRSSHLDFKPVKTLP